MRMTSLEMLSVQHFADINTARCWTVTVTVWMTRMSTTSKCVECVPEYPISPHHAHSFYSMASLAKLEDYYLMRGGWSTCKYISILPAYIRYMLIEVARLRLGKDCVEHFRNGARNRWSWSTWGVVGKSCSCIPLMCMKSVISRVNTRWIDS